MNRANEAHALKELTFDWEETVNKLKKQRHNKVSDC